MKLLFVGRGVLSPACCVSLCYLNTYMTVEWDRRYRQRTGSRNKQARSNTAFWALGTIGNIAAVTRGVHIRDFFGVDHPPGAGALQSGCGLIVVL